MFIITHGTGADVLPFIGLGTALLAEGHRVTLLSHSPYRQTVLDTGMDFVPIDTEEEYAQELRDNQRLNDGVFRKPMVVAEHYAESSWFRQIRREFRVLAERRVPGDTVVIARHTSGVSGLMAAEALGLPVAWVTLPLMERMYSYTIGARMNEVRAEFGLPPVHDWGAWFDLPDMQVALWPEWFDRAGASVPGDIHLTGFVTHDPAESGTVPPAAEELLRADPPPVLIAGGTSMIMHEDYFPTAAQACAMAGRTAILVCGHRELVPDELPPGVHWFPRLPFRDVMPRVAAVIHHGGISTAARALVSRTPQIILPFNIDRPDNAARLHRHGLAEWLPVEQWSPQRVADMLRRTPRRGPAPPTPVDSTASARQAARLVATLAGVRRMPTRRRDDRADLTARLRDLSPEQRADLRRRLVSRNTDRRAQM
jgi:rhamnosyltransferase subunit B